jgi:small-conductance mechanosensitive channel
LVRVLVGVWYLAGAVWLIALLGKSDVQPLAARTGGSAVAVIVLGFAVVAGVRLAERESWAGLFGALTVLISISTLVLLAVEIWAKHPLHQATRTFVMVAISLFLGTISLLFESERDEDADPVRLARGVASLALVALGVLIVLGASGVDVSPRLGGIAAALFVIPALSLPALRLASSGLRPRRPDGPK